MRDNVRRLRCTWVRDDEGGWDTDCGNKVCLSGSTPSEDNMRWCCYCGGRLKEQRHASD